VLTPICFICAVTWAGIRIRAGTYIGNETCRSNNRLVKGTTKTVTVMFTDLVGSTELAERVGPAAATRLRELHFASLRDSMSVHRGSEVKSMGDGIMAVFESVIDGVDCAVTMQRAVARSQPARSRTPARHASRDQRRGGDPRRG
jgi:class 3 adenylate cyclase